MAAAAGGSGVGCWKMLLALIAANLWFGVAVGITDSNDVQALQVLYGALNNPPQLTGWKLSGGDPCGESWMGVQCEGSAVVSLVLSGLGLNGTMGYLLSNLFSLKTMDLSGNAIHDSIPYQLPPVLTTLNLANNNLVGGLPYSFFLLRMLNYLDLSYNNFSGNLPSSFGSLSNLSTLYLQNNQLTGALNILVGLPLINLDVADNRFTGWLPQELKSIPSFIYNGNLFDNSPAPPPPPYTPPPPSSSPGNASHSAPAQLAPVGPIPSNAKRSSLTVGSVVSIVLGSSCFLVLVLLALFFCFRKHKVKKAGARTSSESVATGMDRENSEMQKRGLKSMGTLSEPKAPPAEKSMVGGMHVRNGSLKRVKSPVTATSYTVASLQIATNSFSQENLIGEGSLGRVYKAEFPNGKILAVKKIDNSVLSLPEEEDFLEAVANMSRLRHPNIVSLVGYCAEHGQRLLVHEHVGNGSLYDILHYYDDGGQRLSWNARVKVALGTARALEYLHEVCSPSVVHRNFKSANILLDEESNPHLSDCGLAALTPNTERKVSTEMVGSFGYSAPEFALSGIYTVKSDVYSFGVVMLELMTGRKPLDSSRSRAEQSLVRWATPQLHDIDALEKMVDPGLNGMYSAKSLSRFADVIALCVQPEPEFRPPMSEVVQALVRLVQRASAIKRRTNDESSFGYKTPDHEMIDIDVYSFGVVMLELMTGRKPLDSSRSRAEQSLVRWAIPQLHDIDALEKMVDPVLNGMYSAKSLSRFADVIALCVQPEPEFRPPMSEVVQALVRLVQRASAIKRRSNDESSFGYKTPDHEMNDILF
ncbi:STRUBBELIG-RECEPTOR FAMILY 8-like protein [Drosera capensis]